MKIPTQPTAAWVGYLASAAVVILFLRTGCDVLNGYFAPGGKLIIRVGQRLRVENKIQVVAVKAFKLRLAIERIVDGLDLVWTPHCTSNYGTDRKQLW
jgi:hypothetical protein